MSTSHSAQARSVELSGAGAAAWLMLTAFLAQLMRYFVGIDEGHVGVWRQHLRP